VDAKAGATGPGSAVDPRVAKLLGEVWRHAKAIGVTGGADELLAAAGVPADGTAVLQGDPATLAAGLLELLAAHRAWARFAPVSAG
jgi:catalase